MNERSIIVLLSIETLNELVGLALCDLACLRRLPARKLMWGQLNIDVKFWLIIHGLP